jgi:hypothetical protein
VQRKGREIETAVAALEAEMGQSQMQLGVLEEALANRCVCCLCVSVCGKMYVLKYICVCACVLYAVFTPIVSYYHYSIIPAL